MPLTKRDLLKEPIEHIDFTKIDSGYLVGAMRNMSFSSRELARAADIYVEMLEDKDCTIILTLAGSTGSAGCMKAYADFVKFGMVDAVVATGASIVDMDFFEALGFRHYKGTPHVDDAVLRDLYIDRIYDTFIDEEDLRACDMAVAKIADGLDPKPYSSREFIREMGAFLASGGARKQESLVQLAYEKGVPVFCPAFSDSSAGFGLVYHQYQHPDEHVSIDSVKDFLELTQIKMQAPASGLLMIGGGVPKNFAQDAVVAAEVLGREVPMHRYAVQITVADVRDGGCSSSTLREARSWGKVDTVSEQMVYAEATLALPLMAAHAYHSGAWKDRQPKRWAGVLDGAKSAR